MLVSIVGMVISLISFCVILFSDGNKIEGKKWIYFGGGIACCNLGWFVCMSLF
ncbi:hypothetical protein [Streptococcus ovis]|uniref:hypothetical protein n=1 Tax=Streptococcus ovis TaxID=82806 RepID=UPI00037BFDD5|nr:hypothetical protein [Streptococcus ovis]